MISIRTPLPGYDFVELLHESSRTLVYRGLHLADNNCVIIKLLNCEYPIFNEIVNFRNQYTIAKNLDLLGIVKPLALEHYGNGLALVMEDFGGISVSEYIAKQQLNLAEFLRLAIALCQILEGLYRDRVIHKDIKPSNIIIHPDSKQIKLTDFSISSLLPRETQVLQNPNILEGTLAYISPEQTGRMNRGIDYRSDFYSVGVTFYELLTGQLPFVSDDPMELVHCHITKIPTSPHTIKNDIPQVLSDLVMRLMAKNAEDRYQSALGLKHDLEKCLRLWQETGKIEWFELGQRDRCDRFLIPEKLYGRENEVQTLLQAFDRVTNGACELMLVAGFSGIGKTAVINEVHKPIVRQRGYFIKGKFDQFQRNIPFSAFVQAFRDLMGQLLAESDAQLETWKAKILQALGENGQVIIEVIPELEKIIGQQPPVPELSGSAAQNRFNLLFQKFIQVFTTPEHPLVLFVDDLQWADSASLKLMQLLMGDTQTGYLLLLGAYRDNEVFPAHPLILTLDEVAKSGATVNKITLAPLSQNNLNCLVADTLSCKLELALPLTQLVYQKTEGNPFFATQFLKGLHEDRWIAFNLDLGYWECDLARVRQLALTDDVVEFMATRLHKLAEQTQEVLKLAACIGNQFDLATLAIVCEQPVVEVVTALWEVLQEGFVLPVSDSYKFFQDINYQEQQQPENVWVGYKFLHDRVQQAAYFLIPEGKKPSIHIKIGRLLLNNTFAEGIDERLFEIVNHFNIGISSILETNERDNLARLNLQAGYKAKESTAYESAFNYFQMGLKCLSPDSWETQRELTLEMYGGGVEIAYLNGDFQKMAQWADIVRASTENLLERVKIYEVEIQAAIAKNQPLKAIEIAFSILKKIGITFPHYPQEEDIQKAFQELYGDLADQSIDKLFELPIMSNPYQLAAMRILFNCLSATFIAAPTLYPLIAMQQVKLSLQYGNTEVSAYAYSCYGLFLCGIVGNIELGYQFGQLALKLIERLNVQKLKARTLTIIFVTIDHWKQPIRNSLKQLIEAYQNGLEMGDLEFAAIAAQAYCYQSYLAGKELNYTKMETERYGKAIVDICRQQSAFYWTQIYQQTILNLQGETDVPFRLQGRIYDLESMQPLHQKVNDRTALALGSLNQGILCYLFEQYEFARQNLADSELTLDALTSLAFVPIFYFYSSLTKLALFVGVTPSIQQEFSDRIEIDQNKLKHWAENAPMNYQHKYDLVEAERYRILGQKIEAIELYDKAIAGAKENEFLQEEALANELAAKFYLNWGKEKIACTYMQEAYYCYSRWGAKAKVEDLEKRYPALLSPILKRQKLNFTPSASIASLSTGTVSKTTTGTGEILDLATLMKASRTLSQNIELEGAIANLMQVARENAGAETVALMLFEEQVLMLATKVTDEEIPVINPLPVENSNAVPLSIVNKVKRSQQPLVLENARNEIAFAGDAYIQQHQPQSILCLPLVGRGQLIGILYLENNQVAGAFTSDRLEVLNLLCSQAAISLENARLYQQSQQALTDLQQAQLQLVQSEKMATLGNLVAGVAHEINNPVGFIGGNVGAAQEHLDDLLKTVSLYQQHAPLPSSIAAELEDIDLDFITEDFPKLITSMNSGIERIRQISISLRTFSRKDTEKKTAFNLHDGIDSTLLILKYRLNANEKRPGIEIVKEYGDLPEIKCYPGQLNQVFMNLLANAIDALEESREGLSFPEIVENPPQIHIKTEEKAGEAIVRISDNGKGMSEEVQGRIFEQGFTTKGVGKGTGLGMAIARQILEEKHGGTIACISELGKGTEFIISLPFSL